MDATQSPVRVALVFRETQINRLDGFNKMQLRREVMRMDGAFCQRFTMRTVDHSPLRAGADFENSWHDMREREYGRFHREIRYIHIHSKDESHHANL